jgi:hypothetical protein
MAHVFEGSLEGEYCVPQVVQIHGMTISLVGWNESTCGAPENAANVPEDFKKSRRFILSTPLKAAHSEFEVQSLYVEIHHVKVDDRISRMIQVSRIEGRCGMR